MPMAPFHGLFPDLAAEETRSAHVRGYDGLPDGQYGFLEHYCDEPGCDCRRVVITVVSPAAPSRVLATINYGWEGVGYYAKWLGNAKLAKALQGATLDPLNAQTSYSPALLDLFKTVLEDKAYVDRLSRHYQQFRAAIRGRDQPQTREWPNKRKRPDPRALKWRRRP